MPAVYSFVAVLFTLSAPLVDAWAYSNVSHWDDESKACDESWHKPENQQSPIDIITDNVTDSAELGAFDFSYPGWTEKISSAILENEGHTFKLLVGQPEVHIKGGGLVDAYHLTQMHFHFGDHGRSGSEHQINGHRYLAEIHFVLVKDKAKVIADNYAVLAFLVEIGNADTTSLARVLQFLPQVYNFTSAELVRETVDIGKKLDSNWLHILPHGPLQGPYYRYHGSLTTPPCSPEVTWTVFANPITFSQDQYNLLLGGHSQTGELLKRNFRPPQHLKPGNRVKRGGMFIVSTSSPVPVTTLWAMGIATLLATNMFHSMA